MTNKKRQQTREATNYEAQIRFGNDKQKKRQIGDEDSIWD
jgi:hypothetical protein